MFKLSSFRSSTRSQSFSPLLHCAVDNALIKTFPLVHDALAKFFNICNLPLVVDDPLLHDYPYRVVDGVEGLLGGHKLGRMKSGVTSFSNWTVSHLLLEDAIF